MERVTTLKPNEARDIKKELFDEANEFFEKFKTWSLEAQFHGRDKAKAAAEPKQLSTTHADYTAHKCQRTKPILPSTETGEKSNEPFQTTTTMMEDFKAWDTPKTKKTTFTRSTPKPESCKTSPTPRSLHPKVKETAVGDSSQERHQGTSTPCGGRSDFRLGLRLPWN
ncbi:stabilizer of axonemal microtubules 2-like [Cottoperca gobio]|uniref:Stabilizer of axonemal microtubules 2-like n=1 Tax=Cottoperca gobio TaxID=56716 RepID=A0A6J2RJS8_COTGO|nr:stabilizer of axonemal microtubules 2-like [Cottoperca gobio]